jgi:ATP synthase protein I
MPPMVQDDRPPNDAAGDPRLKALGERLAEVRHVPPTPESGGQPSSGLSGLGQAMRIGSEFVAGVIVGAVIGYTIDRLFGTSPWGMIVFLLLGFAAGTLNVIRTAGQVKDPSVVGADKAADWTKDDED